MRFYLVFSFDDTSKYVIYCAKLLEKYDFKGTFYLDTATLGGLGFKVVKDLYAAGHEIGSHTVTHRDLTKLSRNEIIYELKTSKEVLESIIDDEVKSLAYPYGRYNELVIDLVKLTGYKSARTTDPFNVKYIRDPFRLGITFYTDPHALKHLLKAVRRLRWRRLLLNPLLLKQWDVLIEQYITHVLNNDLRQDIVIHILTHPTFIAMRNDWHRFEKLLSFLQIISVENITVSEYVKQVLSRSEEE